MLVPVHCFVVMTTAGKALVGIGARMGNYYFGDYKTVVVTGAGRRVTLGLSATALRPTARYWDFHVRTKTYTLRKNRAPDTSRTKLKVIVEDEEGHPIPNSGVTLHLVARELTAGHEHSGNKPTGILQTGDRGPIPDGRVNTGPDGVAEVLFVASEVSGPVTIVGKSSGAITDSTIVDVRTPGLVPLGPGAHYYFTGAVTGQHTDNHYGVPAALDAFKELADSVSFWIGQPLGINDISLHDGGLPEGDHLHLQWYP
jgi:hypothetical protein